MNHRSWHAKTLYTIAFSTIMHLSLIAFPQSGSAQPVGSGTTYFPVLEHPHSISGNFGEFRNNHFHAGIDYKTGEKEGKPVFAAAAGYVSRIKVSSTGYGKALYINHPDGTTTVYAHLRAFYPAIAVLIDSLQNSRQQFEVEHFPGPNEILITGNQIIGYSGNTGGSTGPHLHFETRNTITEKPFDPVLKGYTYADSIAPVLETIVVFHPGHGGTLQGSMKYFIPVSASNPEGLPNIAVTGKSVFIGFEGYDLAGTEPNKLGIQRGSLFAGDSLIFRWDFGDFTFSESKHVNAVTDFAFNAETGRVITLCRKLPGNPLPFWGDKPGVIHLKKNEKIRCRLILEDVAGNRTETGFTLVNDPLFPLPPRPEGQPVPMDRELKVTTADYKLFIEKNTFYEDLHLEHRSFAMDNDIVISKAIQVGNSKTAMRKPMQLAVRVDTPHDLLNSKLVIAEMDTSGNFKSAGGAFADGWVSTAIYSTGTFCVVADTVAPEAGPGFGRMDDHTGKQSLVIPVMDILSGISEYSCMLNDQWVCAEYNASRGEIVVLPHWLEKVAGELRVKLTLTDRRNNRSVHEFVINELR